MKVDSQINGEECCDEYFKEDNVVILEYTQEHVEDSLTFVRVVNIM